MLSKTGDITENITWYKCPICGRTLENRNDLIEHLIIQHQWDKDRADAEGQAQYNLIYDTK